MSKCVCSSGGMNGVTRVEVRTQTDNRRHAKGHQELPYRIVGVLGLHVLLNRFCIFAFCVGRVGVCHFESYHAAFASDILMRIVARQTADAGIGSVVTAAVGQAIRCEADVGLTVSSFRLGKMASLGCALTKLLIGVICQAVGLGGCAS